MLRVWIYIFCLTLGLVTGQIFNLNEYKLYIYLATTILLAYIMIEVGLEFIIDKRKLPSYGKDLLIAVTAAALPWIFCYTYFMMISNIESEDALLLARFAAPTSAGVLITLLAAAGLGATWVFRKARILAIFDDLDTVILLIPLRPLVGGFTLSSVWALLMVAALLFLAYRFLHRLRLPLNQYYMALYGLTIALLCYSLEHYAHIALEVLLPAFCLGCILSSRRHHDLELTQEEKTPPHFGFDITLKALFMFLVGVTIPRIQFGTVDISVLILHVTIITLLSNVGKCFPLFCYRKEATVRQRLALCVSLFPRGEVGAGVLVLALGYGINSYLATIAGLSLAINLLLTGVFILVVKWLIQTDKPKRKGSRGALS